MRCVSLYRNTRMRAYTRVRVCECSIRLTTYDMAFKEMTVRLINENGINFAALRAFCEFYCSLCARGKSCWTSNVCTKFHQHRLINLQSPASAAAFMSDSELKTSVSAGSAVSNAQAPVDYYVVLGIQKDASRTDIKKASVLSHGRPQKVF